MEEHFRDALPESERCGCKIVFRSGHPTSLHSLRLCGAEEASKIIILSDFSRPALESDAQNIRCGVVLDEMMSARYGRAGGPNVVLQLHSRKSAATSAWSSTSRIIAVPTGKGRVILSYYLCLVFPNQPKSDLYLSHPS